VTKVDARIVLWIDRGKDHGELNLSIFDQLYADRKGVEADFGGELEWLRMDDARSCKIVANVSGAPGWNDDLDERADGLMELAQTMVSFERSLAPRIAQLDLAEEQEVGDRQ
jgi:hypothetical protein